MATKYVFVTGGVVSGLGKGITAASLGRLLKTRGLKVASQKLDPYINVDPGTMSPLQHGEVFVTDDGTEVRFDREAKPGVSNLLTILSAVTEKPIPELEAEFEGKMYGHLKVAVADAVVEAVAPIRERAVGLLEDPAELDRLLAAGAQKAREVATPVLEDVYRKVGFLPPVG